MRFYHFPSSILHSSQKYSTGLLALTAVVLVGFFVYGDYRYRVGTRRTSRPFVATTPSEDPAILATRIVSDCAKKKNTCYPERFAELTSNYSAALALEVLDKVQTTDVSSRGCHLIAHYIATAETEKDPDKWLSVLSDFDPNACSGGFIHGVVEDHTRHDNAFTLDSTQFDTLCDQVMSTVKQTSNKEVCSHIMGHILLAVTEGDIPAGTTVCKKVRESNQYGCYSGLFMENMTRGNLVIHRVAPFLPWTQETVATQEKICQQYSALAGQGCWREMAHMYAFLNRRVFAPEKTYALCDRASETVYRDVCKSHALGVLIVSPLVTRDSIAGLCSPFLPSKDVYTDCLSHVINSALSSSTRYKARLQWLCETAEPEYQNYCQNSLAKSYTYFGRDSSSGTEMQ